MFVSNEYVNRVIYNERSGNSPNYPPVCLITVEIVRRGPTQLNLYYRLILFIELETNSTKIFLNSFYFELLNYNIEIFLNY